MKIVLDESDAVIVANAMARSRGLSYDFEKGFGPGSAEDKIYSEALRVVAALRAALAKEGTS